MARLKNDSVKWTVALVLVVFSNIVYSRPQVEVSSTTLSVASISTNKPTETTTRVTSEPLSNGDKKNNGALDLSNTSREVKVKSPPIGESIKKVTIQLLDKPNKTIESAVVPDTRIPPKLKTLISQKQKLKTRKEDEQSIENSHVGIAVPVTMEELELENKELVHESSTTNEGLSTWILLSNPPNKENTSISTEPTKTEDVQKKHKPVLNKNKNKKPQNKVPGAKRPIIGSTNKSDLVAGGSAINENVYNKIKDTVLSNVQKNKNITPRSTTLSTTTVTPSTEALTTKASSVKVTAKPLKKNNRNKQKTSATTTTTTTFIPIISESAMLPMEPKEQEIELEVSTPSTTTKKPKRSSTRKKTKTKKRKTTKPKPEASTAASTEVKVKTANKTKQTKNPKKPTSVAGPITSQIYNYFSREVMPSVGVGVLSLAGLVGLASYFLYPFATPVRRTIDVDKKDDIYRHNAEEYGSEGNGQPEEEMLGTVLAGMPIHSKQKLNPYASQTAYINRYPTKKEQDLRYRHVVTPSYPNHSVHYPQQKTGIAHGAVYPQPYNIYNRYQYETRHAYTAAEKKNDKAQTYSPYQVAAVEPIYASPQAGSPEVSAYGSDVSSSVVYGVKPAEETDFKPVYPYESQFYSETTSSSVTYSPTSMYLGSNNEAEDTDNDNYADDNNNEEMETADNKFVVGNVPKELTESATPAVVPEHGPRKLERRRRNMRRKRNVVGSIEEILKATREKNEIFLSNEIYDGLEVPAKTPAPVQSLPVKNDVTITPENKDVFTVYAVSADPAKEFTQTEEVSTIKYNEIESVSTIPVDEKKVTEREISNEVDMTTKTFKVNEVFTSKPEVITEKSTILNENSNTEADLTTQIKNMNTETTTEIKSETTSTLPPSLPPVTIFTSRRPYRPTYYGPTYRPEVITYPPLPSSGGGFFDFLKRVVDFKYRLGMSILQNTSESLNRYLRSMEESVKRAAKA